MGGGGRGAAGRLRLGRGECGGRLLAKGVEEAREEEGALRGGGHHDMCVCLCLWCVVEVVVIRCDGGGGCGIWRV